MMESYKLSGCSRCVVGENTLFMNAVSGANWHQGRILVLAGTERRLEMPLLGGSRILPGKIKV